MGTAAPTSSGGHRGVPYEASDRGDRSFGAWRPGPAKGLHSRKRTWGKAHHRDRGRRQPARQHRRDDGAGGRSRACAHRCGASARGVGPARDSSGARGPGAGDCSSGSRRKGRPSGPRRAPRPPAGRPLPRDDDGTDRAAGRMSGPAGAPACRCGLRRGRRRRRFLAASAAALRKAAEVAPGARLVAVHAVHVPYRGLMPADAAGSFIGEAEAAEAGWRQRETLPAALGKVALVEGAIGQVLTDVVRREDAELIAVGAHARSGVHNALVGSFATRMMRDAPCDLLIARPT